MRSKASYHGHPLHPALIPFPFAFLCGAFGFDLAGVLLSRSTLWTTGGYLAVAGVATALLAAVPGFVDYFATVPPKSTGKTRATRHMLLNLSVVVIFALSFVLRGGAHSEPGMALLVLEAVGVGLLSIAGWMGGTLVSRNQISIDHRYAGAGKWREQRVNAENGVVKAAAKDELKVDQLKLLHVGAERIVLARTADGYAAFADGCTHRGASLADGVSMCGTVQCPWHGSQFDMRTGAVRAGPAESGIQTYAVEERSDGVYIRM